jgi:Protein of unknown function (DUF3347)
MKRQIILIVSALMLISILNAMEMFDSKMNEIAGKYLQIQEILVADKTDGVQRNAAEISNLAKDLNVSKVLEEHKMHFENLQENISMNAKKLSQAKDIEAMRTVFKELSKPMAMWTSMMMPAGINVAYCSMAPGSWLQKGEEIMNPYYGSAMPHCGEFVSKGSEKMNHEGMMMQGDSKEMTKEQQGEHGCRNCHNKQKTDKM